MVIKEPVPWVQILALQLASWVILDDFSVPQFLHLRTRGGSDADNSAHLGLLRRLSKLVPVPSLEKYLARRSHSLYKHPEDLPWTRLWGIHSGLFC